MDIQHFDRVAKLFARRHSRRETIRGGLALGVVAAAGTTAGRLAAQDATPTGTPEVVTSPDPHPSADAPTKIDYLFVQHFAGGTWVPKAGEDGVYTLTLAGAAAQTVYFSDRPERIFGLWPTQEFLDGLGFTPANPPNAALVARPDGGDDQETLVIELLNPVYDSAAGTLSYDARVLADYGGDGLAHAARQQTDYTVPETLGAGGLFIDGLLDCTGFCGLCYQEVNGEKQIIGQMNLDGCNGGFTCELCNNDPKSGHYGLKCSETFPGKCSFSNAGWDCFVELC